MITSYVTDTEVITADDSGTYACVFSYQDDIAGDIIRLSQQLIERSLTS